MRFTIDQATPYPNPTECVDGWLPGIAAMSMDGRIGRMFIITTGTEMIICNQLLIGQFCGSSGDSGGGGGGFVHCMSGPGHHKPTHQNNM